MILYVDGSCQQGPNGRGPGSWAVIRDTGRGFVIVASGREENTTSQRMELTAGLKALEYVRNYPHIQRVEIGSDSQYLVMGMNEWREQWERRAFRGVKNVDLWCAIIHLHDVIEAEVIWTKVAGHVSVGNKVADRVARNGLSL